MIHPSAIVDSQARIAADVEIGPYAIIGADVEIGPGCSIGAHAVIKGNTRIGSNNRIYQFVSLGEIPQDKKYAGENTRLEIGDNNEIREFCTFNLGTVQDGGVTRVGNNNWIMAYVHVAHDCLVGNNTILANCTQLAGHVTVGDYVILGGFTGVHQFCKIGAHSLTAVGSVVLKDIPPYVTVSGNPVRPHGINSEGLKRRGFSSAEIMEIKRAYKTIYKSGLSIDEAGLVLAEKAAEHAEISILYEFLGTSTRGLVR